MYCDLWSQYINVRKLFKGGNYSRAETIWGNTVYRTRSPELCKDRLHFYSNESAFYILEGSLCIANSALYFLAYRQVLSYRISANSFRGNYSFLNLIKGHSTYRCGNYSREETIRGNTVCQIWELLHSRALLGLCIEKKLLTRNRLTM